VLLCLALAWQKSKTLVPPHPHPEALKDKTYSFGAPLKKALPDSQNHTENSGGPSL
jgi:hypothetical protein